MKCGHMEWSWMKLQKIIFNSFYFSQIYFGLLKAEMKEHLNELTDGVNHLISCILERDHLEFKSASSMDGI